MKQVIIDYSSEPNCLKELRDNGREYEDLKNGCLKEVRTILKTSQNEFCAYCERKLTPTIFIEHYKSREEHPELQLEFSNFIAVCSGKTYIDKLTGKHIEHCDTSKANQEIKIDPRIKEHIDSIYYESDSTIKSTNSDFNNDLNATLKLNSELIRKRREEVFDRNFKNLRESAHKLNLNFNDTIQLGIKKSFETNTEYSGYLNYRYKKLAEENNPT